MHLMLEVVDLVRLTGYGGGGVLRSPTSLIRRLEEQRYHVLGLLDCHQERNHIKMARSVPACARAHTTDSFSART